MLLFKFIPSPTLFWLDHKESNYPPSIIKQVPFSIESRLSSLSLSEKIFNDFAHNYQETLKNSGYDWKLKHQKYTSTATSKQQRKRKIIWFNPPCSISVSLNVGRYFLNLDNKQFPPHHTISFPKSSTEAIWKSATAVCETWNQKSTYIETKLLPKQEHVTL